MTRLVNFSVVSARGVWCVRERGGGRGRIDEPNCKAAYLFLFRSLKVAEELIYFHVTQAFPKGILHIGP